MIFKRKIYDKFLEWKNETNGKKALLVEGARRIGKSTIAEEFAKNEYKSYILIDFAKASEDVKSYFHLHLNDLDTFYMLLSVQYGVQLYERDSIIIFDEVQRYPKAREAIKYLVADGRYDFIETGSLISIKENVKDIVIPSEERHIKMYPLDFEEFCWALNEEPLIQYIMDCFHKKIPLERSLHEKAMLIFKQYILFLTLYKKKRRSFCAFYISSLISMLPYPFEQFFIAHISGGNSQSGLYNIFIGTGHFNSIYF